MIASQGGTTVLLSQQHQSEQPIRISERTLSQAPSDLQVMNESITQEAAYLTLTSALV